MEYKDKYLQYKNIFEEYMDCFFEKVKNVDDRLLDAVKYSLFAGGKRVRPVLMLALCEELGGNVQDALPFSLALECIHTSSLIHDDMPEMDNDTLRRGMPTNHVRFGQATALLAGDTLINFAYEICLNYINNEGKLNCSKILAEYSGMKGMLSGQSLDKYFETSLEYALEDLETVYLNKTSKLLTAPLLMASCLNDNKFFNELKIIGENLGKIFQATDDVLDFIGDSNLIGKSVGKDQKSNKLTIFKFYNLDQANDYINNLVLETENIIKTSIKSEFLSCFTKEISGRKF